MGEFGGEFFIFFFRVFFCKSICRWVLVNLRKFRFKSRDIKGIYRGFDGVLVVLLFKKGEVGYGFWILL